MNVDGRIFDGPQAAFERDQRAPGEEVGELQVPAIRPVEIGQIAVHVVARIPEAIDESVSEIDGPSPG